MVISQTAVPVSGTGVTVHLAGTQTLAALFSDDGITPTTNPVTTDSLGRFAFYVADGKYDLTISGGRISSPYTQSNVLIVDPLEANSGDAPENLVAIRLNGIRFADQFVGVDIGAKINAAVADLGANGGTIVIPAGTFTYGTTISVNGQRDIYLVGASGQTAGAAAATVLQYTGTGLAVDARSSTAIHISNLQFLCSNAGLSGPVIDFSHGVSGLDTVWAEIDHCSFFATGFNVPIVINFDQALNSSVHHSTLQNYVVGIQGAASGASYSNVVEIRHCNFSSSVGTAVTSHLKNPHQAWVVDNCTFEMGNAAGTPHVCFTTSGVIVDGFTFTNNSLADHNASAAYTHFDFSASGQGNVSGLFFASNLHNGTASSTGIVLPANAYCTYVSNVMGPFGQLFTLGTGCHVDIGTANFQNGAVPTLFSGNQPISSIGGIGTLLNVQGQLASITGNGAPQTAYSYTLPGGLLKTTGGFRVTFAFNHVVGTGNVTYTLNFGGSSIGTATLSAAANGAAATVLINNGATNSQVGYHLSLSSYFAGFWLGGASSTVDTTVNQTIAITLNMASSEHVTPQFFMVELVQ